MKLNIKNILTICCIVLLFRCSILFTNPTVDHTEITEKELLNNKNPIGNYGQIISLEKVTDLDIILKSPKTFINKEILISGVNLIFLYL